MDVTPFPRGTVASKSSTQADAGQVGIDNFLKHLMLIMDVHQDELFKVKKQRKIEIIPDKKAKSAKRKRDQPVVPEAPLPGVGLGMTKASGNNKVIKIETINHSKYLVGCQAMGYILQVNDDALVISLPGGVTANVPRSEVSDLHHRSGGDLGKAAALSDIFEPKQPVRCVVIALQERATGGRKKKTIVASLRAMLINRALTIQHLAADFSLYGSISSVEDNG